MPALAQNSASYNKYIGILLSGGNIEHVDMYIAMKTTK